MLKLTRKLNESIILQTTDGLIEVLISKVNGAQVGVGIKAPPQVNIYRKELSQPKLAKPFELY